MSRGVTLDILSHGCCRRCFLGMWVFVTSWDVQDLEGLAGVSLVESVAVATEYMFCKFDQLAAATAAAAFFRYVLQLDAGACRQRFRCLSGHLRLLFGVHRLARRYLLVFWRSNPQSESSES